MAACICIPVVTRGESLISTDLTTEPWRSSSPSPSSALLRAAADGNRRRLAGTGGDAVGRAASAELLENSTRQKILPRRKSNVGGYGVGLYFSCTQSLASGHFPERGSFAENTCSPSFFVSVKAQWPLGGAGAASSSVRALSVTSVTCVESDLKSPRPSRVRDVRGRRQSCCVQQGGCLWWCGKSVSVQGEDRFGSVTERQVSASWPVNLVSANVRRRVRIRNFRPISRNPLVHPVHVTASEGGLDEADETESEDESVALKEEAKDVVASLRGSSVYLVGMMGTGKTTIGRLLADALGYYHFDLDELLENAAGGASVAEIIAANGIEEFRDAETETLKQLAPVARCVVSTGSGAVIRKMNWSYLRHGVVVCLHAPVEVLSDRVVKAGLAKRPLLLSRTEDTDSNNSQEQASSALLRIFEERKDMFALADATVSLTDVALATGVKEAEVSPGMLALQVLKELKGLVKERKDRDVKLMGADSAA